MAEAKRTTYPNCSIYVLRDPRDEAVRYVGSAVDVQHRLVTHICNPATPQMGDWLRELEAASLRPEVEVIEGDVSSAMRYFREYWWVRRFSNLGVDLLNVFGHMTSGCGIHCGSSFARTQQCVYVCSDGERCTTVFNQRAFNQVVCGAHVPAFRAARQRERDLAKTKSRSRTYTCVRV